MQRQGLTLNHDAQVRPAEGGVGVLCNLHLALGVHQEHSWLWEGVLCLPDVAGVADVQAPLVHVSQLEAVGDAVGDLLGLCGGTQRVQLQNRHSRVANVDCCIIGCSCTAQLAVCGVNQVANVSCHEQLKPVITALAYVGIHDVYERHI